MNCRKISGLLSAYLEDGLDERTSGAVGRHLESCSSCRQEMERLRRLDELLVPELSPRDPADGFADRVMCCLSKQKSKVPRRSFFVQPRFAWLTAAACLLIAGAIVAQYIMHTSTRAPSSSTARHHLETKPNANVATPGPVPQPEPAGNRPSWRDSMAEQPPHVPGRRVQSAGPACERPSPSVAIDRKTPDQPFAVHKETDHTDDINALARHYQDMRRDPERVRLITVPIGQGESYSPGSVATSNGGSAETTEEPAE